MNYHIQINHIANKWAELGLDVPESVYVSKDVYDEILEDMRKYSLDLTFPCKGRTSCIMYRSHQGSHKIIKDERLPSKTIHMNRMTYDSIIIEDILLDDQDFNISDN